MGGSFLGVFRDANCTIDSPIPLIINEIAPDCPQNENFLFGRICAVQSPASGAEVPSTTRMVPEDDLYNILVAVTVTFAG